MGRPKSQFGRKLSAMVSVHTLAELMAVGYLQGNGNEYGAALRMLLKDALKDFKAKLTDRERRDFDDILKNVYLLILKVEPKPEDMVEAKDDEA